MLLKSQLFIIFSNLIFASTVQIAVSANVSYAVEELKRSFNRLYPDIEVKTTRRSGKLTAQIERGAPFDILLSADMSYPDRLYRNGFAITKPLIYARGTLALFSREGREELSRGVEILADSSIKRVAIANPKTATIWIGICECHKRVGIYGGVIDIIIFGEI